MDDKEGGHAEEAGRTSAQDEVLHAHEGDEDAGGPMTMDGDGEPEDGNEEDDEADEGGEYGDDGADDEGVKTQILEQMEGIVASAKELFGEETVKARAVCIPYVSKGTELNVLDFNLSSGKKIVCLKLAFSIFVESCGLIPNRASITLAKISLSTSIFILNSIQFIQR